MIENHGNVIEISAKISGREHPTQKPIKLMEKLATLSTQRGQVILDMFCGSGSTGVACVNTGRKFIGIEKDPKYFKIAKTRIKQARIKQARKSGGRNERPV